MEEQSSDKPRPFSAEHGRIRRESGSDAPIGAAIRTAAEDADSRVLRQRGFPPPTEAERELIAASLHQAVQLFTTVLLAALEDGEQERYTLVPHDEADLAKGRISIGSPIGRAIYQEYPGSVVSVKTPAGPRLYRILQVHT